jgi:hypothetical protein
MICKRNVDTNLSQLCLDKSSDELCNYNSLKELDLIADLGAVRLNNLNWVLEYRRGSGRLLFIEGESMTCIIFDDTTICKTQGV